MDLDLDLLRHLDKLHSCAVCLAQCQLADRRQEVHKQARQA